jgi:hypothetical protein
MSGDGRLARGGHGYLWLVLALGIWLLAVFAAWLHLTQGPATQRIHVRWAPTVSPSARLQLERQAGLRAGVALDARTWSYLLQDRSRDNIARLIADSRVEDTHHLDRVSVRVQLDRPDLHPRVRWLLETGLLFSTSVLLALVAALTTWRSRNAVIGGARAVLRLGGRLSAALAAAPADARPGRRETIAGSALGLLILLPSLVYGPYDGEIVQATIMPSQVFYRALFHGEWLYWLNNLGFGTPMPLGDPLMFHPVFAPLAAFASLRVAFTAVWIAHVIVMVVYFLRLAAVSGVESPAFRVVLLACYIGSAPFASHFLATDSLHLAISWSLYPVLLFYLRSAILGDADDRFWMTTLRLGLLFGFWAINAHTGYIIVLALALAIYVIVAAPLRGRVYMCLGIGAFLCIAISASRIYTLVRELILFPPGGVQRFAPDVSAYGAALLAPIVPLADRGLRDPFLGLGLGVALVIAAWGASRLGDRHLRGCVAAAAAAAVLTVTPPEVTNRILPAIGNWMFRDPVTLFGLLAGGRVLQRSLRDPRRLLRQAAIALIVIQVVQQGAAIVWPNMTQVVANRGRLLFYRYQGEPHGLGREIVEQARQFGPRIYLSQEVDSAMRGSLSADGLHYSFDLVLLGLNPVNGWFKNVSMAPFYPPYLLMESFISGDHNVVENAALLDVLGINLVLSTERESGTPAGLVVSGRPRVREEALHDLVVLGNPDAWPQAVLMDTSARAVTLPVRANCSHQAALCREFEPLARLRLAGDVRLVTANGRYDIRVPPADRERLLFISATYRPEWKATSATGDLPVSPVAGAFLGVSVPANVTDMTLAYVPRAQMALTWFSNVAFFGIGAAVLVVRRRPVTAPAAIPESHPA